MCAKGNLSNDIRKMVSLVSLELWKPIFGLGGLALLNWKHFQIGFESVNLLGHLLYIKGFHFFENELGHEFLILKINKDKLPQLFYICNSELNANFPRTEEICIT